MKMNPAFPSATDIPELLKKVEQQNRVLETILSRTTDFANIYDLAGRIVYANRVLLELWKLELKDVVGKTLFDLKYPDELAHKLQNQIQEVILSKKTLADEVAYTSPSGVDGIYEYIFSPVLAPDGTVELVVGTSRDVSQRRKIELKLTQSEDKFRLLADTIPQLAWMANADGYITWYNQRWYEYTGKTLQQMEGWGWQEVHHPEYLPRVMEDWTSSIANKKAFEIEFPLRGADDKFRMFLTRALPQLNDQGEVIHWFGTNTDIEDKKNLLEAEQEARIEAERVGQLKDEFLATLSHELRTPLNAILGWSQILRRQKTTQGWSEGLSIIERSSRVQAKLIDDLLDMSRIISGKLRMDVQYLDIVSLVRESIESVKLTAEAKNIQLIERINLSSSETRGDPARLQQILWNILSNAIKFTPKNGTIEVSVRQKTSLIEISITDSGAGIKPEFLPFVFERFRQADGSITRTHAGLGLGLSIVKKLVELHGGKVSVTSPGEGLGATFVLELPVLAVGKSKLKRPSKQNEVDLDKNFEAWSGEALQDVTVLVVDDDEDARKLISRLLTDSKASVLTVSSVEEGLKCLKANRPSVILSDIGMPSEDGYSFIKKVRMLSDSEGGTIPAAALTAFARTEDRERALEAGYQAHIVKPVEPSELVKIVAALAGKVDLQERVSGQFEFFG